MNPSEREREGEEGEEGEEGGEGEEGRRKEEVSRESGRKPGTLCTHR